MTVEELIQDLQKCNDAKQLVKIMTLIGCHNILYQKLIGLTANELRDKHLEYAAEYRKN